MAELIYREEAYAIVGAAMDVYYTLGVGFLEPVYHNAMIVELGRRRIPFESEKELELYYKNVKLEKKYVSRISNIEVAQLMNYLKITRKHLGLLINFGSQRTLEWNRYVI